MEKIYLSLESSSDNQKFLELLKKQAELQLVDLNQEDVTVIVNGPLTDLAQKLYADFTLRDRIRRIIFIGGSDSYGDITVCAEKNVYADIKAAQHVFMSGIEIVMFGLNVTKQLDNRALAPLVYLKHPDCFKTERCGVYVETRGKITLGKTVTDLYSDAQFKYHNVDLVTKIDVEKYNKVLEQL